MTQPVRVLVIDDDAENLAGMCERLAFWGYDAEGVGDRLPDGDALHVIEKLKALAIFVIAFSGWDKAEPGALAAGADAFVLKPILDALEQLLRSSPPRAVEPATKKKRSNGD